MFKCIICACRFSTAREYFNYSAIGGPYAKWTLSMVGRASRPLRPRGVHVIKSGASYFVLQ